MKLKQLFKTLLPLLLIAMLLSGNAQAALLDFGPIVPEVVGSTPPNIRAGFPLWFRDTNRVPLELCLEEVPGCLFAAVDRPDLTKPLAFPNIPDELFYYSATATIGQQLLFAGVEMNFFDNGDGTYEQVGFSRVRIRIDSTIAGNYIVTTPWKQYFFTVDQATIAATGGIRVINATEDIGLGPDGAFAGVLGGSIGPYVYSQGAPFVTAAGSFLGTGAALPVVGSTFTDPVTGQPANIFRIQGPPGFTTVSTDQFAITGKLYITEPTPTPLTVDKATYALDNTGLQVNAFATTEALSNQTNPAAPFPLNFALTGALSSLQLTGTNVPTQDMTTNNPADGKFFSASGLFAAPGPVPPTVTVTNTADAPPTVITVPLVDEVVIDKAVFNPLTGVLTITASSFDRVANPALQAFLPGVTNPLGTLSNGQFSVTFPVTDNSGPQPKTYTNPASTITVKSAKGGSATAPVVTFIPVQPAPATGVTVVSNLSSPQAPGTQITFNAFGSGGSGSYEYQFSIRTTNTPYSVARAYSASNSWTWTPTVPGPYDIQVDVRSAGSTSASESSASVFFYQIETPATAVSIVPDLAAPQAPGTPITFTATATGGSGPFEYRFWVNTGNGYAVAQEYTTINTFTFTPTKTGIYDILVDVRGAGTTVFRDALTTLLAYQVAPAPATAVSLTPDVAGPQPVGSPITFTAVASGGTAPYEYRFWVNVGGTYVIAQDYTTINTWVWTPLSAGNYDIMVDTRAVGSTLFREALNNVFFYQIQ